MTLRQNEYTIQAICTLENSSKEILKFVSKLSNESIVDIFGTIIKTRDEIKSLTITNMEISISKIYCISSASNLPIQLYDLYKNNVG